MGVGVARALAALLVLFTATAVQAQGRADDGSEADEARRMFEEGVARMAAGEPDRAAELLRASLARMPRPATAFNLALALRDARRPLEGLEVVAALLANEHGALDASRRAQAERLRDDLASDVAHLEVRLGGVDRAALVIDGEPRGDLARDVPARTYLAPGAHTLEARVPDGQHVEETVDLVAGERTRVLLHVGPRPLDVDSPAARRDGGGIPAWVWIASAIVVVGAGAAVAVLLATDEPEPTVDRVYGQFVTLALP